MSDPSDQNRVEIAEMCWHHYHGTLFRKASELAYLSHDMDLIPKRLTIPEESTKFLNPGAIEQPGKPEFYDLAG